MNIYSIKLIFYQLFRENITVEKGQFLDAIAHSKKNKNSRNLLYHTHFYRFVQDTVFSSKKNNSLL